MVFLFALVMVLWVVFDVAVVVGPSMVPTLASGEYTLNTKTYNVAVRGDIVVFHEPGRTASPSTSSSGSSAWPATR